MSRPTCRAAVAVLLLLAMAACGSSSKKPSTPDAEKQPGPSFENRQLGKRPLDPEILQQFATPLPVIPARTPDTTTFPGADFYVVTAKQGLHDFGLRNVDGSPILDPKTGKAIETLAWGYDATYLGPTIEARSGQPVVVRYVNGLVDGSGRPLQDHLLYVDRTLDGVQGNPLLRTVPHLHGGHTSSAFDGNPLYWFSADPAAKANGTGGPAGNTIDYTYENDQQAATLWFHDHALGVTRLNVYAGLAAFYLLRDPEEAALGLPSGKYEVPLVLQDKSFNDDGSLAYRTLPLVNPYTGQQAVDSDGVPMFSSGPEFFGDTVVVNGAVWPVLDVEPRRYRLRMVNGADSRFFNLWLEITGASAPNPALKMTQIGADSGLLPAPVALGGGRGADGLLLANGERADVIVDFSDPSLAGQTIVMRNDARAPFPDGDEPDPLTTGRVMAFRVKLPLSGADASTVPAVPRPHVALAAPSNTRVVDLQEMTDVFEVDDNGVIPRLELRLNGLRFMDPVTETPRLGAVEDWIIVNTTVDMHPMHLHLVAFEVLERGSYDPGQYERAEAGNMGRLGPTALQPGVAPLGCADPGCSPEMYALLPNEAGLKDTVKVPPGGYVRIRAKFDRPGQYVWHCHILSHEENDMMRPFEVVP
jgi:spore coat protein A, manganese oxidase